MVFSLSKVLRHIYLYMLFQGRARDFSVFHEPKSLLRIPPAACRFGLEPHRHVGGIDAQGHQGVCDILRRGGVQSVLSTTNSTVFRRYRAFASYRNRTQSSASPYFFSRLLVPRWPGLRISRVFTLPSEKNDAPDLLRRNFGDIG